MKRRLLPLVLAGGVGLAACADPAPRLPNLLILGHAGSGFFTPLNPFNYRPPSSWLGIENALTLGADGVEVDLQLSQDSVPVLYHDPRLESMSTGRGCVSQLSAAALTQLRYRGGPPYDWLQKEQPITFDTLLARLSRRPRFPRLHLDLHEYDHCQPAGHELDRSPALLRQLARCLARYRVPPAKVLLVSTNIPTIRYAHVALPQVPAALEITTDDFASSLRAAQAEGVGTLVLSGKRVTPAQTAQAHAAGLRVVVFGGRSAGSIKRILAAQPDEVEIDNVAKLLEMQGRR